MVLTVFTIFEKFIVGSSPIRTNTPSNKPSPLVSAIVGSEPYIITSSNNVNPSSSLSDKSGSNTAIKEPLWEIREENGFAIDSLLPFSSNHSEKTYPKSGVA